MFTLGADSAVIQYVSTIMLITAIVMELGFWVKHPSKWYYAFPLISFMAHVIIFYIFVAVYRDIFKFPATQSISEFFTTWSALIRFHTALVMLAFAYVHLFPDKAPDVRNIFIHITMMARTKIANKRGSSTK